MRERALSIGADLSIESRRGSGATVRLIVADTGVVI
jgi:nitrate/nitrite-specific signal transduction histidine kinase